MRHTAYDTLVRSFSGRTELRHVTDVREWRIEPALDSDGLVLSILAADGQRQSFHVGPLDAADLGEVLRRRTAAGCA